MESSFLATASEIVSGYWAYLTGGAMAIAAMVGTAIRAYIRRPK